MKLDLSRSARTCCRPIRLIQAYSLSTVKGLHTHQYTLGVVGAGGVRGFRPGGGQNVECSLQAHWRRPNEKGPME